MNNFHERRESILSAFNEAKIALEGLNADIEAEMKRNQQMMATLAAENAGLAALNSKNAASIKALSKLF